MHPLDAGQSLRKLTRRYGLVDKLELWINIDDKGGPAIPSQTISKNRRQQGVAVGNVQVVSPLVGITAVAMAGHTL